LKKFESRKNDGPVSLYDHCKEESGLTDPVKIRAYMNRHYGLN
jgi:hypothetical protein